MADCDKDGVRMMSEMRREEREEGMKEAVIEDSW